MSPSVDAIWAAMQEDASAVRETEGRLARSSDLEVYLAHAANVMSFTEALRDIGMPIKATFSAAALNYQLARQAVTLAETLERFEGRASGIRLLGPSHVLLLNEADRRFEREGRAHELDEFLQDLSAGMSRRELREKYLPPRRSPEAAVLAALNAGRVGEAKQAFEACDLMARARLRRLAFMLARISGAMDGPPVELTGSTIDDAVMAAVAHDASADRPVAPCNPDDPLNGD